MNAPAPHPLAELFPMLSERETAELADDIVTYGQREPIVLLDSAERQEQEAILDLYKAALGMA